MATDCWLDDLAKTLARTPSRRQALKAIAAAVTGAFVAASGSTARAESNCVEACRAWGKEGREFGECVANCERGLCGNNVCGPDEFCCNPSCGICAPIGGACIQLICGPS